MRIRSSKKNEENAIDIRVKDSTLKWWKQTIEVSDLFIANNLYRWHIEEIVSQDISDYPGVDNRLVVSYFDTDADKFKTATVTFQWENSKMDSITAFTSAHNFEINKEIFKSLNFANIKNTDVTSNHPNVHVKSVSIKDWKLFNRTVLISIISVIGKSLKDPNGFETETFKTITIGLDQHELIAATLELKKEESFLYLNDDLEFYVKQFTPVLNEYKKFFRESEIQKLFKIINSVEVINPKIMSEEIDIFNKKATAGFKASILIGNVVKNNFVFESYYDATNFKNIIIKYINEFPLIDKIKGFPRNDIKINDIFSQWDEINLNLWSSRKEIKEIFINNVKVRVKNIDINANTINLDVVFKNGEVIFQNLTFTFEKSIDDYLDDSINQHLVKLVNEEDLLKYPRYDLEISDFQTVDDSKFKILNVKVEGYENNKNDYVNYKFNFLYDGSTEFTKVCRIQFAESKISYYFNKLSKNFIDVTFLEKVNVQYYEHLIKNATFNAKWISIDSSDLDKIILTKTFNDEFEVKSVQFKRVQLSTAKEVPFKITAYCEHLDREMLFNFSIEINNKEELRRFNELSSDDITFVNPAIIHSYPIPILDVIDFKVDLPFSITDVFVKYNEKISLVKCEFEISYNGLKKYLKKEIYFANNHLKKEGNEFKKDLSEFKRLADKDIDIKYDPDAHDYHVQQKVNIIIPNHDSYFVNLEDWKLLHKKNKVKLYIAVIFGDKKREFTKIIKYNNKLSRDDILEWKEANYEPRKGL